MIDDIVIVYGNTATVCEIKLHSRDVEFSFAGEAKKHPKDDYDKSIGEAYAVGRAFEQAGIALLGLADMAVEEMCGSMDIQNILAGAYDLIARLDND